MLQFISPGNKLNEPKTFLVNFFSYFFGHSVDTQTDSLTWHIETYVILFDKDMAVAVMKALPRPLRHINIWTLLEK